MIEIVVEHTNTGRTPWCRACDSKESKTLFFSAENSTKSSAIHLCDDCLRELVRKINETLQNTEGNSKRNYILAKALYARIVSIYDRVASMKSNNVDKMEVKKELMVLCGSYMEYADGVQYLDSENKSIVDIRANIENW